jgi:hypothetical protein
MNVYRAARVAVVVETKMKMAGDVEVDWRAEWKERMCQKTVGKMMTRDSGRALQCLLWTV